jgi:hypothetical protein
MCVCTSVLVRQRLVESEPVCVLCAACKSVWSTRGTGGDRITPMQKTCLSMEIYNI